MLIFSYRHILSYETLLPPVLILCPIAISYCILIIVSYRVIEVFLFLDSSPVVRLTGKIIFYSCSVCTLGIIVISKYSLLVAQVYLYSPISYFFRCLCDLILNHIRFTNVVSKSLLSRSCSLLFGAMGESHVCKFRQVPEQNRHYRNIQQQQQQLFEAI